MDSGIKHRFFRFIFWSLSILLVSLSQANGADKPIFWEADGIIKNPSNFINLRGPDKQTVATVSVQRVKTITDVKQKIEQQSGLVAKLLLQNGAEPNAASGPNSSGNFVVIVNLAMMDLIGDDKDAYATVLGHEYAHLTLGHSQTRKEREGVRSGLSSLLGAVLGLAGVPFGGTIANLGTTVVSRVYSRDEERDADNTGLKYATNAGFDPMAAPKLWEKMAAKGNGAIPFLSTHPAATERVDNMRQLALSLSKQRPISIIAAGESSNSKTNDTNNADAGTLTVNPSMNIEKALIAVQRPLPSCTGLGGQWTNCVGERMFGYQDKYFGEFTDGNPNGKGTWTTPYGEKYVGNFKGAFRDGEGILYGENGSIIQSGTWTRGQLVTPHPVVSFEISLPPPVAGLQQTSISMQSEPKVSPPPDATKPSLDEGNVATKSNSTEISANDRAFWNSVKDTNNSEELRAYLDQFPTGIFSALAKLRLSALKSTKGPVPATSIALPPIGGDDPWVFLGKDSAGDHYLSKSSIRFEGGYALFQIRSQFPDSSSQLDSLAANCRTGSISVREYKRLSPTNTFIAGGPMSSASTIVVAPSTPQGVGLSIACGLAKND